VDDLFFSRVADTRSDEDEAIALPRPGWPGRPQLFEHGVKIPLGEARGFGNMPPIVRLRFADPHAVGIAPLAVAAQDTNEMGIVRGPVEDDSLGGVLEHLARRLRLQVELEDGVRMLAGLLDEE